MVFTDTLHFNFAVARPNKNNNNNNNNNNKMEFLGYTKSAKKLLKQLSKV